MVFFKSSSTNSSKVAASTTSFGSEKSSSQYQLLAEPTRATDMAFEGSLEVNNNNKNENKPRKMTPEEALKSIHSMNRIGAISGPFRL